MNQQSVRNFSKSNGNTWSQPPMDCVCTVCTVYISNNKSVNIKTHMEAENLPLNDKHHLENSKKTLQKCMITAPQLFIISCCIKFHIKIK